MSRGIKVVGCGVLAVLWVMLSGGVAGAQDPDPEFDNRGVYTFTIKPESGEIAVEAVFTLSPSAAADAETVQAFEDRSITLYPYVLSSAVDIVAESQGERLPISREPDEDVGYGPEDKLSIVTSGRHVVDGTVDVTVRYSVPGVGLDAPSGPVTVDEVFASFPVWVNPFLDSASVTVLLPPGFSVSGAGSDFRFFDDEDSRRLYMPFAEGYAGRVTVANHEAFDRSMVSLGSDMALEDGVSGDVEIRALPGGEAKWSAMVTETLAVALPELVALIGQPWPVDDLVVTQLSSEHSYSAGYFDLEEATLYISDNAEPYFMLQELSAIWLNEDLVESPWLLHALSHGFLESVSDRSDIRHPMVLTPDMGSDSLRSLHHYDPASLTEDERAWVEASASWVGRQLVNEIGIDAFTNLVAAAETRTATYGHDGDLGTLSDAPDWRWALDELENGVDVTEGAVATLIEEWVVATSTLERDRLEARQQARNRLAALDEADGEWVPPIAIRQAMSEWNFKRASELLDAAEEVAERREALVKSLGSTGIPVPAAIGAAYLDATDDYDAVLAALDDAETAAGALRNAHAVLSEPADDLADAAALFDAGDFAGALATAADAQQAQRRARTVAVIAGICAAGLGVAGVAFGLVQVRRRRQVPTSLDSVEARLLTSIGRPLPAKKG